MIDYRCTFSGVSLLGSECMAVVVALSDAGVPSLKPLALPLFGTYDGSGGLVELNEGDNAQRLLDAFLRDLAVGEASIDWQRLGFAPLQLEHPETWLSLLSANVIHKSDAITWCGHRLGVVFFEGNVAAALMQHEPVALAGVAVEDLPAAVLAVPALTQSIYGTLREAGPSLRCKYGLSFVALASLCEAMMMRKIPWHNTRAGYVRGTSDPALFLAEAYRDLSSDDDLVDALREYSAQWGEDDEEESSDHNPN